VEFYLNLGGYFVAQQAIPGVENVKSIQWVDFDNDGDLDLFITRVWESCKLFERIGDWQFLDITFASGINMPPSNSYGSSWGDYNNDQLLDLYICNYGGEVENFLYKNNGDGTFSDVTQATVTGGGVGEYSFLTTFVDFDRDGWQDLFIINDRLESPNILLHNNEGVFHDVTYEDMGVYNIFSMSNSVADYDNDADLDIFISNNPFGHLLHRNNGDGTFVEVSEVAGVATYDHCWAAQWFDYNLDGWQDLHICCSPFWGEPGQNKFYKNNQDGTFDFDLSPGFDGDEGSSHSSALGDFNNDGIYDLFVMNTIPDISSLWESSPGQFNYLKVTLEGTASNTEAIGSWIEIWINGQYQMRYTLCGEAYMSQNTNAKIFGLGSSEQVDSMKVSWPSGLVEMYHNLAANQHLLIKEGQSSAFNLIVGNLPKLCSGDTLTITAPEFESYLWSTGDTTQTLSITQPGDYFLMGVNEWGVELFSDTISVNPLAGPIILSTVMNNLCFGDNNGVIELQNDVPTGLSVVMWSNGLEGAVITDLPNGEYGYEWVDEEGCIALGMVLIESPSEIILNLEVQDISCFGENDGAIGWSISGGFGEFIVDWGENDPPVNLQPGEYPVNITDENGCAAMGIALITEPDLLQVDLEITEINLGGDGAAQIFIEGGMLPYEVFWSQGATDLIIEELSSGDYGVWVLDANLCSIYTSFELINTGIGELQDNSLWIYPIPFYTVIEVRASEKIQNISIYDMSGRMVESFNSLNSRVVALDLEHISRGSYICVLELDSQKLHRIIIKAD
jgi:hypothetical protein